jgi:hypothetical protein
MRVTVTNKAGTTVFEGDDVGGIACKGSTDLTMTFAAEAVEPEEPEEPGAEPKRGRPGRPDHELPGKPVVTPHR